MSLESRLAGELIRRHPERAAAALDRLPAADAARRLASVPAEHAAEVAARMAPHAAVSVLTSADPAMVAAIFAELEQDVAARLARRLDEQQRTALLTRLPQRLARPLQTLLSFPENSAGALMDPDVLALTDDLTAEDAMTRVRELPDQARYNLYVVDRGQALVGVLNLRELMLAPAGVRLREIMTREPERIQAHADRAIVVSHPGWRRVHSLPVVDERGCYLGAVRYRTLRQLQDELLGSSEIDADTSEALGEVFASGVSGVLDALTGPGVKRG